MTQTGEHPSARLRVGQADLDVGVRRADDQLAKRPLGPDTNFDRARHVKAGRPKYENRRIQMPQSIIGIPPIGIERL